jgi:hypothetical protein
MLSSYAHIRTEAKRKALEEVKRKRMVARERNQRVVGMHLRQDTLQESLECG